MLPCRVATLPKNVNVYFFLRIRYQLKDWKGYEKNSTKI